MDFENIFAARAFKGAILMDSYHGGIGWAERMSTETLDVSHPYDCVLGQYFGDFVDGHHALRLIDDEMVAHGFDLYARDVNPGNYALLDIAWIAEILKRRGLNPLSAYDVYHENVVTMNSAA